MKKLTTLLLTLALLLGVLTGCGDDDNTAARPSQDASYAGHTTEGPEVP